MSHSVLKLWSTASVRNRPQAPRRRDLRLRLEQLEDRLVPSTFNAATVSDLIADIKASNTAGGANTINLTAATNAPYILAAVDNTTDGATGLPVIAAKDKLIIVGNGDTVARSTATGTPAFRLFDVASRASLTLQNLTLQAGLAFGSGVSAEGGAIYNQGTLDLNGVTVQNNVAQGQFVPAQRGGQPASGGGIYSGGSLTLEGNTKVQNNQALGGNGASFFNGFPGGAGYGGGVYVAGGAVNLTSDNLSSNWACGGTGYGSGAGAFGGALYVAGGTVMLSNDNLTSNAAKGSGGGNGSAFGGALCVAGGTVTLTSNTLSSNTAQGGPGSRSGHYGQYHYVPGGNGFGGALYAGGGTLTLGNDTVTGNTAQGSGVYPGLGEGGGLYIAAAATVYLDAFTLANTVNNTASTSNNDIFGSYIGPHILVGGFPSPTTAGVAGSFTVTATDASGNTNTGYTGTVHFSSSDPQAILPADYNFTAADQGVHTFTAALKTAGTQAITVIDKNTPILTSTQSGIAVNPAAASALGVSGFPSPLTAGLAGSITVTAMDAYGNTATGYSGTVAFASSDGQANLPAAYTFTAADLGSHTFSATLKTAGTQSIAAMDKAAPAITGAESGIVISAASASRLSVASPASTTAGTAFSITVSALDAFNNVVTSYKGTVSFTSTDSSAVLPGPYTFTAADNGMRTFTGGVTLKTAGSQTIAATGTALPAGVISWWPGEGNANDIAGANNGTLVGGVTFAPGLVGQAFSLNGVDASVNFGSAPAFAVQDFTLDAWVSVDPAQNIGDRRVLSRDDAVVEPDSVRQMYVLKSSSGAGGDGCPRIEIMKGGVFTAVTAPSPLTAGFHHLAATRSGNIVSLYVDGVMVASTTTTITGTISPNAPLVLGQVSPADQSEFFQGLADEVDLFGRALSPAEIQWIYNAGSAGKQNMTTIGGSASVTVSPATASAVVVTGLPSAASVPFSITVTALDSYGNVATGYAGTIHFTSTDLTAALPPDTSFMGADDGVLTFTGIVARKRGTQMITVTDMLFSSITGSDVFNVP